MRSWHQRADIKETTSQPSGVSLWIEKGRSSVQYFPGWLREAPSISKVILLSSFLRLIFFLYVFQKGTFQVIVVVSY